MGCVDFIAKYLLFSVTFVITLLGIVVIALGVLFLLLINQSASGEFAILIPVLVLVFGCVVFLVATFGCCGAIGESQCLIITYAVFLAITLISNIYLVVVFNSALNTVVEAIEDELDSILVNPDTRDIFMGFEGLFGCCGTTGPEAYTKLDLSLPITCCHTLTSNNITIDINDISNVTDPNEIKLCNLEHAHPNGCTHIITDVVLSTFAVVFYFFIFTLVVEAVGVLSASYLAWHFRSKDKADDFVTIESRPPIHVRDMDYQYQRPHQVHNIRNAHHGHY